MAIAAPVWMRRLLLFGRCSVEDIKVFKDLNDLKVFKVIRVAENKTGGSVFEPPVLFSKSLPDFFFYFCPSERLSAAANFCGSILCFIEPFLTIDMPPVSSDTTMTTASVISLKPIAAR